MGAGQGTGERIKSVRLRTWVVIGALVIGLIFYLLVGIIFSETINLVDFVIMSVLQIVTYTAYFPDGELYGTTDKTFQKNKDAYNQKANGITQNKKLAKLRQYCKEDYERRKTDYIENELGAINITASEYEELKKLTPKEINKLHKWEYGGQTIVFDRHRRKRLYRLLFRKIPIEQNTPETIMSAVENNGFSKLMDGSITNKTGQYLFKFFQVIVWGGFLAFVTFYPRDGIGLSEIARIAVYFGSIIITAVTSFSAGERCQKVYKSKFYLDLSNFLDGYGEWEKNI